MNIMTPDIKVKLRLLTTAEGGRKSGIPETQFGCPLFHCGEAFDCRLLLDQMGGGLELGEVKVVPIKFMSPDKIKGRLKEGDSIRLWEGKDIAEGEILEVLF